MKKIEEDYSVQYYKFKIDDISDSENINQKINQYSFEFQEILRIMEAEGYISDITISFDVLYDENQQSIFVYFLIPSNYKDLFGSEEEWSFHQSEMPANYNLKPDFKEVIKGILD